MKWLGAEVNNVPAFHGITGLTHRLNVLDPVRSAFGKRHNMIRSEISLVPTRHTSPREALAERLPLHYCKGSDDTNFCGAAVMRTNDRTEAI